MKHPIHIPHLARLLIVAYSLAIGGARATTPLELSWENPPVEARLPAYWWWLNGNVTEASITRDLQEMQAKGFGGAVIFDANGAAQAAPPEISKAFPDFPTEYPNASAHLVTPEGFEPGKTELFMNNATKRSILSWIPGKNISQKIPQWIWRRLRAPENRASLSKERPPWAPDGKALCPGTKPVNDRGRQRPTCVGSLYPRPYMLEIQKGAGLFWCSWAGRWDSALKSTSATWCPNWCPSRSLRGSKTTPDQLTKPH